jgi:ribosomal protein S18 acetylase RimI-like enzyme
MVDRDADPEAASAPRVRAGTAADADAAARLHVSQIGEGFLARLGTAFLRRLYRRVAQSPDSFLLVAASDDDVVGFVAGSVDLPALYRRFAVRDGVVAAASSVVALARAWPLALETLRYGRARTTRSERAGARPSGSAELLAVAVDPAWQGRRVGQRLVEECLAEFARREAESVDVVVGAGNVRAVSLYRRAGFDTVEEFELHRGARSLRMCWAAAPTAGGTGSLT